MSYEESRGQYYLVDQFVVDLGQTKQVMDLLNGTATELDSNKTLGLTLVQVRVEAAREGLRRTFPDAEVAGTPPLDALLTELRAAFARENPGESLTVGKNRLVTPVQLLPYPNAGVPPVGAATFPRPPTQSEIAAADLDLGSPSRDVDALVGVVDVGDVAGGSAAPLYWLGHDDFVTGIIHKTAPGARFQIESLTDASGGSNLWLFALAIARVAASSAKVINCSAGTATTDHVVPLAIERAVAALGPDVLLVAAAGNHGEDPANIAGLTEEQRRKLIDRGASMWPARLAEDHPNVVAVGALGPDGRPAAFNPNIEDPARPGTRIPVPWIAAWGCGVEIMSTYLTGKVRVPNPGAPGQLTEITFPGKAVWSGTSFATAEVTAAITVGAVRTDGNPRAAFDALPPLPEPPQPPAGRVFRARPA